MPPVRSLPKSSLSSDLASPVGPRPTRRRGRAVVLPRELPKRARVLLRAIADRTKSLAAVGRDTGHSLQWVWRLANTSKNFPIEKAVKVLEEVQVPPRFFFEELCSEEKALSPAWLIAYFREPYGDRLPFPLQAEVAACRERILDAPPGDGPRRHQAWLLDAAERRHTQDAAVRGEVENVLAGLLGAAEPTRGDVADLCHGLGLWATISRRRGRRNAAIDALVGGLELADALDDDALRGHLLGRAAYLLHDLGQTSWALWTNERATEAWTLAGDTEQLTLALSDRALFLQQLGRHAEAAKLFRLVLERVPSRAWRVHAAAHFGLATAAEAAGDLASAEEELRQALKVYQGLDSGLASMCWKAGTVAGGRRSYEFAAQALRRSMELFGRFGQSLQVVLVAVDLADVFARQGKRHALRALGDEALSWLEMFQHNPWADAAVGELARLLYCGEASSREFDMLRRQLNQAGRVQSTAGHDRPSKSG
jgi:tetratricopeptide (TPR) repeat protein